jgi:hypothetical protein
MMRLVVLSIVAFTAAAPAAATPTTGFAFGRTGGNIRPFTVTIATTGAVTATGAAPTHRATLTKQQLADLNRIAFTTQFNTLAAVTACKGTLPDVAAQFIRVGARTVRVHGSCLPKFNRLWRALNAASS